MAVLLEDIAFGEITGYLDAIRIIASGNEDVEQICDRIENVLWESMADFETSDDTLSCDSSSAPCGSGAFRDCRCVAINNNTDSIGDCESPSSSGRTTIHPKGWTIWTKDLPTDPDADAKSRDRGYLRRMLRGMGKLTAKEMIAHLIAEGCNPGQIGAACGVPETGIVHLMSGGKASTYANRIKTVLGVED